MEPPLKGRIFSPPTTPVPLGSNELERLGAGRELSCAWLLAAVRQNNLPALRKNGEEKSGTKWH